MKSEDKIKMANRLLANDDFQELIMKQFIKDGTLEYSLQHNIRAEGVLDEVIARRTIHNWFFDIITSGEQPNVS